MKSLFLFTVLLLFGNYIVAQSVNDEFSVAHYNVGRGVIRINECCYSAFDSCGMAQKGDRMYNNLMQFNKNGNLTYSLRELIFRDTIIQDKVDSVEYDSAGRMTKCVSFDQTSKAEIYKTYSGKQLTASSYTVSLLNKQNVDKQNIVRLYTYDDNNRIVVMADSDSQNSQVNFITNIFYDNDRVQRLVKINSSSDKISEIFYTTKPFGYAKVEYRNFDDFSSPTNIVLSLFNHNDLIIKLVELDYYEDNKEHFVYEGNTNGLSSSVLKNMVASRVVTYTYDENGLLVKQVSDEDGSVVEIYYEYLYDDYGNWNVRVEYQNDCLMTITEREIEYFFNN